MRRYLPLPFLLFLLGLCLPASAAPVQSHGTFTDKAGKTHTWTINAAHTLVWDDKPFVPVGGRFQAQSWSPRATEADFKADVAALELLKRNRVTDIYVQAGRGAFTDVPVANIQRLLDYLDANGFTYGISINDGPREILTGYDIRPGKYRNVVPPDGGSVRFPIDTLTSALYFLVAENGLEIVRSGDATMVAEGARVAVDPIPGKFVVFLLPRKAYFTSAGIGVPNLWEGFDTYRDALMVQLRKVRFGPGFRFFVDPLPADLQLTDTFNSFIPTNPAFANEWTEWLAKRYKSVEGMQQAWGMNDRPLHDFREAANLVPLWGGGKGVEFFYNLTNGEKSRVNTRTTEYWKDLNSFKTQSVRDYMNDLAAVLKGAVADVPVVYRTGGYSPLFAGIPPNRGFDGIGISAYGRGADLVTRSAGYAYVHAAEAPKTMWLPVVGTADAVDTYKNTVGYSSRTALHQDLDWLRDIGARGFYVDSVRSTDASRKPFDLASRPDQLGWLADYADVLAATGVSSLDRLPTTLFYPRGLNLDTASVRPLAGGGWWLPSDRPGVPYDFGPSGRAYALADPDGGVVYYLWNPEGRRTIRLKMPKAISVPGAPLVRWSASAQGEVKKEVLTLTIGPDPIRLENYPIIPVPLDAFKELYDDSQKMIAALKKQHSVETGRYELNLDAIKQRYNTDNPIYSIAEIQALRDSLRVLLRPYAWLEAERASVHTFDAVSIKYGASGNQVLVVDQRQPGAPAATATFAVTVRTEGTFNVWVAASPDAPLSFSVDGKPLLDEGSIPIKVGNPYADGALIWHRYGTTTLPRGTHAIELRANGPAMVDTLLITQGDFTPNGATPPPVTP